MCDERRRSPNAIAIFSAILLGIGGGVIGAWPARADCTKPSSSLPICLYGTTTSPDYQSAVVEKEDNPGQIEVKLGDMILDWRVVAIAPKSINIENSGTIVTLPLQPQTLASVIKGPMKRLHAWEARGEREPPP